MMSLQVNQTLQALTQVYQMRISLLKDALGNGQVTSWDLVQGVIGEIRGLNRAIDVIRDLDKHTEEEDFT